MSLSRYQPRPFVRPSTRDYHTARRQTIQSARPLRAIAYEPMQSSRREPVYRRALPETKYFDTSFGTNGVATSGDWTGSEVPCTNYIQSDGTTLGVYGDSALIPSAVGSGYGQIIGSHYRMKKLRARGVILPTLASDQADVPAAASVRLVLVQDLQPNGAQAQGEDVFPDMGTAVQDNFSFLAMAGGAGGRFRILKDEWLMLNPAVTATDGASTNSNVRGAAHFSWQYKPTKPIDIRIKANSATPTVASLSDVNIFMLAHSNYGTVALWGCARCYYED